MRGVLDIRSEVRFVDLDTAGEEDALIGEVEYLDVLPLYMIQEMAQAFSESTDVKWDDVQIAQRILDYSINDA